MTTISVPINTTPQTWIELSEVLRNIVTNLKHDTHTHVLADVTDSGTMAAENDATSDGKVYGRKDGAWAAVTTAAGPSYAFSWFNGG